MRASVEAYVALGGNLGDARATVWAAMAALDGLPHTEVLARSSLYRTAPWQASGPDFINAVVRLRTGLTAPALLQALQALELSAGRERPYPNAPRTLDLDLLFYGEALIRSPLLTVPHPRLNERAFVLAPLADVAPQRVPMATLQALMQQQRVERCPD